MTAVSTGRDMEVVEGRDVAKRLTMPAQLIAASSADTSATQSQESHRRDETCICWDPCEAWVVHEVALPVVDPRVLGAVVASDRLDGLLGQSARLRDAFDGAAVISVSSTATGGGVAEMLQVLLPYARGAGIDARWLVIEGDERASS